MADTQPQPARLMPITGIGGQAEEERRGTSVLLAVMGAVQEFGRALTAPMGAPAGRIETFIECEFPLNGRKSRPDGMIRITGRNKKIWTALVEVKTRKVNLRPSQVEEYIDVAAANGYDAVLTISSQLAPYPGEHPVAVDKRKLKAIEFHHLSWSEIHTEAALECDSHSVRDTDQAWILSEFLRYLESPKSGAFDFGDNGSFVGSDTGGCCPKQLEGQ